MSRSIENLFFAPWSGRLSPPYSRGLSRPRRRTGSSLQPSWHHVRVSPARGPAGVLAARSSPSANASPSPPLCNQRSTLTVRPTPAARNRCKASISGSAGQRAGNEAPLGRTAPKTLQCSAIGRIPPYTTQPSGRPGRRIPRRCTRRRPWRKSCVCAHPRSGHRNSEQERVAAPPQPRSRARVAEFMRVGSA
jgi:hypothetical protein